MGMGFGGFVLRFLVGDAGLGGFMQICAGSGGGLGFVLRKMASLGLAAGLKWVSGLEMRRGGFVWK
jgi:hypothetical protein